HGTMIGTHPGVSAMTTKSKDAEYAERRSTPRGRHIATPHAPISPSEHPYASRVSRARSGEERLVRPIVGSTTVESARVWLTFEVQPYARETTRSVPNPTRRALSVSSRRLLDATIEARWWRFHLLVARVTARRETSAVGTVGDDAVLPGGGSRG